MHLLIKVESPLCICELMDVLHKPQYKISRCLSILKEANLINEEHDGRLLMHSSDLSEPLNENLFDSVQLVSIKENTDLIVDINTLNDRLALRKKWKGCNLQQMIFFYIFTMHGFACIWSINYEELGKRIRKRNCMLLLVNC